jgi:hypothetical protein
MKPKHLKLWLLLFLLEGFLSEIYMFAMPFDTSRGHTINYTAMRLALAGLGGLLLLTCLALLLHFEQSSQSAHSLSRRLDEKLTNTDGRLFTRQFFLGLALVFITELYLMSYISIPQPLRPVLVWGWLTALHTWLMLRRLYRNLYRQRPGLFTRLRSKWQGSLPVQRQVMQILFVIGLIYFAAFIPINSSSQPTNSKPYFGHDDEIVIYPSVIKTLTPGATITESVNNLLIDNNWWYGYPYLPISAATLILPRIIYGPAFGEHVQLNLLLLRQFINILPMLLALALLVYLVTRFKSKLVSVGLYLFLLFLPGVFLFNIRFWHPDSLILLLILLTFFFLQRDALRFKKYFYLAAVTCALAAAIKLWGFFFFLAIAGYLLAGLLRKVIPFKGALLAGVGFIAVMGLTFIISSPCLLYPATVKSLVNDWGHQLSTNATGYNEPDPEGVYQTGLPNWLRYFDKYFMHPWFFFFAFTALALGSLWGSQVYLNRLLLAWCLVTAVYLVEFVAVKSYQYMMPLMLPLYAGGFLLPALADSSAGLRGPAWLTHPVTRRWLWGLLLLTVIGQFAVNINTIIKFLF